MEIKQKTENIQEKSREKKQIIKKSIAEPSTKNLEINKIEKVNKTHNKAKRIIAKVIHTKEDNKITNKEIKKKIPEKKIQEIKKLAEQILKSKTLMIADIKGLPSPQMQSIKKELRGKAVVQVAKKNIFDRTIKELKKESALKLLDYIKENCAFIISDLEGFELASILSENKNPVFAKAGQIALEDIKIEEGSTDLPPGPAITEFGVLGIQIAVEEGKITVKKEKTLVKKGNEIKANIASMLQKLDIKPLEIGLNPIVLYDVQNGEIFTDIKIDKKQTIANLKNTAGRALGFAQKIVYYCKETIGYLLAKANLNHQALSKFIKVSNTQAQSSEESKAEEAPKDEQTTDNAKSQPNVMKKVEKREEGNKINDKKATKNKINKINSEEAQ